ncbi:MAG TPA: formate/nitrite transporter family protein [Acidimicrobiales bacterium]
MPIPIPEAVDANAALAATKAKQARRLPAYLLSSAFAGAFVGVAVVLLLSVGGRLVAAGAPYARLVQGAVFGIALTLVVFAGAELFTGNAMVMLQGIVGRTVTARQLAAVWVASLVGNVVGSVGFAWMVHAAGSLGAGGTPSKPGPGQALATAIVTAKNAASGSQLFWRALLCNMLVCLALWMAARAQTDGARLAVLWWGLLAFIASGFEHSIANATTFTLAILDGSAAWVDLGRNLAWTVPGNVVGGGLLVGLGYAWIARPEPARSRVEVPIVDVTATPAPAAASMASAT